MTQTEKKVNQVTFNIGYLAISYCVILLCYNNAIAQYRSGSDFYVYLLCVMPIAASCISILMDIMAKRDVTAIEKAHQQDLLGTDKVIEDFVEKIKFVKAMPVIASLFSLGFTATSMVFLLSESNVSDSILAMAMLGFSSLLGGAISVFMLKESLEALNIQRKVKV